MRAFLQRRVALIYTNAGSVLAVRQARLRFRACRVPRYYLIGRIKALPSIEIHMNCEVNAIAGGPGTGLTPTIIRNRVYRSGQQLPPRDLFLLIGADHNSDWISAPVHTDAKTFIITDEASAVYAVHPAIPGPLKPACLASSPLANSGLNRSSGSERKLARGRCCIVNPRCTQC